MTKMTTHPATTRPGVPARRRDLVIGLPVVILGDDDQWAVAVWEPGEEAGYDLLAVRFRRAGMKCVSPREWHGGLWPQTTCSVTVQEGHLTQTHTGSSRLLSTSPPPLTARWQQAAGRGRALLALVRPGTLPSVGVEGILPDEQAELGVELLSAAVERRELLCGLARVLKAPVPPAR